MDKILCLGKNFPQHAAELGETQPNFPVIFGKFPSVLLELGPYSDQEVQLCPKALEIHHELEVVFRVSRGGHEIPESLAMDHIDAVSVGLDLTDRPLQEQLKRQGHPWTIAKNFRNAAIVGPFVPLGEFPEHLTTPFSLEVDGQLRQNATLKDAFFGPSQAIAYLSRRFALAKGDLIYMGTPTGVAKLDAGSAVRLTYGPIDYSFETHL
jgi:2-keto-4-pentenoate hydratase/2-oxohepta-3-ene-1,7-dioic acid hydratase in catechol pathway